MPRLHLAPSTDAISSVREDRLCLCLSARIWEKSRFTQSRRVFIEGKIFIQNNTKYFDEIRQRDCELAGYATESNQQLSSAWDVDGVAVFDKLGGSGSTSYQDSHSRRRSVKRDQEVDYDNDGLMTPRTGLYELGDQWKILWPLRINWIILSGGFHRPWPSGVRVGHMTSQFVPSSTLSHASGVSKSIHSRCSC